MRHPLDRPIGSDCSYEIVQRRRLSGELGAQSLDSQNRRLYPIPCAIVQREGFIASREVGVSPETWEERRLAKRHGANHG